MTFAVTVEVRPREGIADPEAATIERALEPLGYTDVAELKAGRWFRFRIEADSVDAARARVDQLCEEFLSNPVIEDVTVAIDSGVG